MVALEYGLFKTKGRKVKENIPMAHLIRVLINPKHNSSLGGVVLTVARDKGRVGKRTA